MQRRVIVWQLFGYLMSWKSQIVKHVPVIAIYEKVKERNLALTKAAARSTTEFQRVHTQQFHDRTELREKVKAALTEAISKADMKGPCKIIHTVLITETASSLAEQRNLLADSKSFISDRDAAMLGKAPAMNVVQFRTSLLFLLSTMEGVLKLLPHEADERPKIVADLVDQVIVYGEEMLVALIRLERNIERISQKSLFALTVDILQGR